MIDVVDHPLYSSERRSRVRRTGICHDLDVDEVGAWGIALVNATIVAGSEGYSGDVSPVPVAVIRVIAAIVAVLGAPRSGIATAEPLRVSELVGLLLVVVVLVREVV